MAIIITKSGHNSKKIDKSGFLHEDNLQEFIYDHPDTIPLYEIDESIRLLILAREFPTSSGSIDAVGIDESGELYIIETKLYKNPDKRLVVAQVLDYGASLSVSYQDTADFVQVLESKVDDHFGMGVTQKISEFYECTIEDSHDLLDLVKSNLNNGNFRFVVLMDNLEKRLRDLIFFLNRNSRFDIYGVELEFYKYKDFEITIPKLYGAEIKKEVSSSSGSSTRKNWTEENYFEEIENNLSSSDVKIVKDLYEFFMKHVDKLSWGTGYLTGSFGPCIIEMNRKSILGINTDGVLSLNYAWLNDTIEQQAYQKEYIRLLGDIFKLPANDGTIKYPTYSIKEWGSKSDALKDIVLEMIDIVNKP